MQSLDYKVPGGKLIRIDAEIIEGRIKDIKISGDFFIHPEESIAEMEKGLLGMKLGRKELNRTVSERFKGYEAVGISAEELVNALMKLVV
jgi:lipoate---protein ligase